MNTRSNIFQILRQEDKIKRKSKKLKEEQLKKENDKKNMDNYSFYINKYSSWNNHIDDYDEFFYEVDTLKDLDKPKTNNKNNQVNKKNEVLDGSKSNEEKYQKEKGQQSIKELELELERLQEKEPERLQEKDQKGKENKKKNNTNDKLNNKNKKKQTEKKKTSKKAKEANNFDNILLEFTKNDVNNNVNVSNDKEELNTSNQNDADNIIEDPNQDTLKKKKKKKKKK